MTLNEGGVEDLISFFHTDKQGRYFFNQQAKHEIYIYILWSITFVIALRCWSNAKVKYPIPSLSLPLPVK